MFGLHKIFAIALLVPGVVVAASTDIDSIPLISTVTINGKQPIGTGGQWVDLAGTVLSMNSLGFKKDIYASLSRPELSKYFSTPAERERVAHEIEQQVRASLGRFTNSTRLINGVRIATNETTKRIMQRIFEVEGISETGRSEAWSNRILYAVNSCFSRANNSSQAQTCANRATADLQANMGLAIAHQSGRKHMDALAADANVAAYRSCIQSRSNTEACVLSASREGAEDYIQRLYRARQNQQLPGFETDLSARHMPALRACLNGATTAPQFFKCGDQLTLTAGQDIARVKATNIPAVREAVSPAMLQTLGNVAAGSFQACATENIAENRRDADGSLMTSNCETRIRQALGHNMREPVLGDQISANLKDGPEAVGLTRQQLDERRTEIMSDHRSCIDKVTTDEGLFDCFLKSGRDVAGFLGDARFKSQLSQRLPNLPQAERDAIHANLMSAYRTCLAAAGNTKGVESCAVNSARELAHKIGTTRLQSELGIALGTDGLARDATKIAQLQAAFRQCLDSKQNFSTLEVDLKKCGDDLKDGGVKHVQDVARVALHRQGDSQRVAALKNDLIANFENMANLMPSGPTGAPSASGGVARLSSRLNDMISYNPQAADRSLRQVLAEVRRTGATAQSVADKMVQSGSIDQMIKGSAFHKVVQQLKNLKGDQRPSKKAFAQLASRDNFDKIFTPEVMSRLRQKVGADLNKLSGNFSADETRLAGERIEKEVKEILLQSERFGRLYARDRMQAAIASKYNSAVAKARKEAGIFSFTVDWFKPDMPVLGRSAHARRAEDKFLELLLRPVLVDGQTLNDRQFAARKEEVARHVAAALNGRSLPDERRQVASRRDSGRS